MLCRSWRHLASLGREISDAPRIAWSFWDKGKDFGESKTSEAVSWSTEVSGVCQSRLGQAARLPAPVYGNLGRAKSALEDARLHSTDFSQELKHP